jgi:hypothetical protein
MKEFLMATKSKPATAAETVTAEVKEFAAKAETTAKQAYAKTGVVLNEVATFTKGNADALLASGKIVATGLQDLSKTTVAEGKTAIATVKADVAALKTIKTPTDLVSLPSKIVRRNLDTAFTLGAKNTKTLFKLFDEAFAPLTARADLAVSKFKKAA